MEKCFIYVVMAILFFSFHTFSTKFLGTKENLPTYYKIVTALTYLTSLSALVVFALLSLNLPGTIGLTVEANNIYNFLFRFIFPISQMLVGILSLLKGKKEARFYCLAWSGMYLAVIVGGLRYFAFMRQNIITEYVNQFGSVVLVIFISLSLSDQLRMIQRKKEQMLSEVESSNQKMRQLNALLENTVKKRTDAIKLLLDNADQAFLCFGQDLVVTSHCSTVCKNIFGMDVTSKTFTDLLPIRDKSKMKAIFLSAFTAELPISPNLFNELPSELTINGKIISFSYKLILPTSLNGHRLIMVTLSDVSGKYALERSLRNKNLELENYVRILNNNMHFSSCVRDYINFCEELKNLSHDEKPLLPYDKYISILLQLHTYIENFRMFGMEDFVLKLEMIQQVLSFKDYPAPDDLDGDLLLEYLLDSLDDLKSHLNPESITTIQKYSIKTEMIKALEEKAQAILGNQETASIIIDDLHQLRFKPFSSLLASYPAYIEKLAERCDKYIERVKIEAEPILVDTDYYHPFTRVLIHVFRNCISHAIESPEERIMLGKPEYGRIDCKIYCRDSNILISISDDGCGIQIDSVKEKILENRLLDEATLNTLDDSKILSYLFLPGFSTSSQISHLSGRGVGLPSVLTELTKLGGTYYIDTVPNKGTTFTFVLPFKK